MDRLTDGLVVVGSAVITFGLWAIWPPLALMWAGVCLMVTGLAIAADRSRKVNDGPA